MLLPLTDRVIPVIADEYVDREFGTGAVKVTPAHDPNDFEVGKRHDLPMPVILDENAKIQSPAPEKYVGMDRFEARKVIVEDLERAGLLVKIEKHVHSVGYCHRSKVPIEPYLSTQWFLSMEPFAEPALKAVRDGRIRFVPRDGRKSIISGWRISGTGVSVVSSGGDTVFLHGTVQIAVRSRCHVRIPPSAAIADRHTSLRMRMSWIPGFQVGCGHFPHLAGRKRPGRWNTIIRAM